MKNIISNLLLILVFIFSSNVYSQWKYPISKTVDSVETYFGETIADPYQWLEDLKNVEVTDWFKSQSDYTDVVISEIPNSETLVNEMLELDKVKKIKYSGITERSGRYFLKNDFPVKK